MVPRWTAHIIMWYGSMLSLKCVAFHPVVPSWRENSRFIARHCRQAKARPLHLSYATFVTRLLSGLQGVLLLLCSRTSYYRARIILICMLFFNTCCSMLLHAVQPVPNSVTAVLSSGWYSIRLFSLELNGSPSLIWVFCFPSPFLPFAFAWL